MFQKQKEALITGGILLGGAWILSQIFKGNKEDAPQQTEKGGWGGLLNGSELAV